MTIVASVIIAPRQIANAIDSGNTVKNRTPVPDTVSLAPPVPLGVGREAMKYV
jgi:hypothetical protein